MRDANAISNYRGILGLIEHYDAVIFAYQFIEIEKGVHIGYIPVR